MRHERATINVEWADFTRRQLEPIGAIPLKGSAVVERFGQLFSKSHEEVSPLKNVIGGGIVH